MTWVDRISAVGCLLAVCAGVGLLASRGPVTSAPPAAARARKGVPACRLIADPQNKFTYVPPPVSRALNNRSRLVTPPTVINVTYVNFTPAQQAAFQFAVDIWKTQVGSPVPIEVFAQMTTLGAGVLGQAGPSWIYPLQGSFYPIALANKLSNMDLLPGASGPGGGQDIDASFNANFNWYYGTDGRPAAGQYDFASVVLHELGHGLGFEGSMNSPDGVNGTWGDFSNGQTLPEIYDRFTANAAGTPLLSFVSPSTALFAQLTGQGGGVFWFGGSAVASNAGTRPRLYAPNPWAPGSSYVHLDETTYPPGNPNSLMTFALGAAEAIHDPGPIVRGAFQDEGWMTDPCSVTLSPPSATFSAPGGVGSVGVATSAGCAWTAVSNAPNFLSVTAGATGMGNGTVTYSVAGGATAARSGTITIGDATLTVTQLGPVMALDRTSLAFSATTSGGAFTSVTGPQTVHVTFDSGNPAWTATANQPWVQISRSGTGNPPFVVNVVSAPGLPSTGGATATITVNAAGVANSPLTLPVTLNLQAAAAAQPPFGFLDTPADGLTGVTGSIAVTGWALDDVGVANVGVYRNCLVGIDSPETCQQLGADNVVFIGEASFVAGVRPDVEAQFASYPFAYRAGWGYLMLTNMLPHVTAPLSATGGQGSMTIYAYASDLDNHRTLLGQKVITLNNDNAIKPFGAIDTPGQGDTVSGIVPNYGWALTPPSATGPSPMIPTNGSTIFVVVDGAVLGPVSYNLCRATPARPGGCRDDVATLFPNMTNIRNGIGAIGVFNLDTTKLANGLHSIAWSVTDDAGRVDGIGSRFFTVQNGSGLVATESQMPAPMAGRFDQASLTLGTTADIARRAASDTLISGRTGFDFDTPLETLQADDDGVVHVRMPELGRLELWLGENTSAGYLRGNSTLRPLPAGSAFDAATGQFTWAPGPGFVGTYDLVFLEGAAQIVVEVTVAPKAKAPAGIREYIDLPSASAIVQGRFIVAGWAADLDAWQGSGIGAVHVWARRLDIPASAPVFLGAAQIGLRRPDVGAAMGSQWDRAGWEFATRGLEPGKYDITAYLWSIRTGRFEDARKVTVTVH